MPTKGFIWTEEYRERYYSSPRVQIHLEAFKTLVKEPKSDETKEKMSRAKKNVPKTEAQKAKMAETQVMRHALFKKVKDQHPLWDRSIIWAEVKRILNDRDLQDN